ncbi:hypothetical protein ACSIGC_09225 [Tenacibaculum sp. ZS6-P6]|uniref:hypothetical protein n=1 Tax=Tenacibaculum sp. ZS6-P6 TaxID=3447503 RepID=UPI003F9881B8
MIRSIVTKLTLILVFSSLISCSKKDIKQSDVEYFFHDFYCFDFVKQCELEIVKLKNRDTIIYVNSSQNHGNYEEFHGKLTRINDTIYHVKPFKHYIQKGNIQMPERVVKDSVFFYCDSSLINKELSIEYLNGRIEKHRINSTENKIWINEKLFNNKQNRIYIKFNHKNPVVNEIVEIVSKYSPKRSDIIFSSEKKSDDFYVIINKNRIKTLSIGEENNESYGLKFSVKKVNSDKEIKKIIYR